MTSDKPLIPWHPTSSQYSKTEESRLDEVIAAEHLRKKITLNISSYKAQLRLRPVIKGTH